MDKAFDSFEDGTEIHDFLAPYIRIAAGVWGIADHPVYFALRRRI